MEEYRIFQENQKNRKHELERMIAKDKADLELKHRQEKAALAIKHNELRNQLNKELIEERQKRPKSTKNKYVSKKRLFQDIDEDEIQSKKKVKLNTQDNNKSLITKKELLSSSESENDSAQRIENEKVESAQLVNTSTINYSSLEKIEVNEQMLKEIEDLNTIVQTINPIQEIVEVNFDILDHLNNQVNNSNECDDPLGELFKNEYSIDHINYINKNS